MNLFIVQLKPEVELCCIEKNEACSKHYAFIFEKHSSNRFSSSIGQNVML